MSESDKIAILCAFIGISGLALIAIGTWIGNSFNRLVESIEQLNVNVAVVVEKVNSHEKRIERLEEKK